MKKTIFVMIVLLAIGFVFIGCDTGLSGTDIENDIDNGSNTNNDGTTDNGDNDEDDNDEITDDTDKGDDTTGSNNYNSIFIGEWLILNIENEYFQVIITEDEIMFPNGECKPFEYSVDEDFITIRHAFSRTNHALRNYVYRYVILNNGDIQFQFRYDLSDPGLRGYFFGVYK